jgi:hypothetical protein
MTLEDIADLHNKLQAFSILSTVVDDFLTGQIISRVDLEESKADAEQAMREVLAITARARVDIAARREQLKKVLATPLIDPALATESREVRLRCDDMRAAVLPEWAQGVLLQRLAETL